MSEHPVAWTDLIRARERIMAHLESTLSQVKAAMGKLPVLHVNGHSLKLWDNILQEITQCNSELISFRKLRQARLSDMKISGFPPSPEDDSRYRQAGILCRTLMQELQSHCRELQKEISTHVPTLGKIAPQGFPSSPGASRVDICV